MSGPDLGIIENGALAIHLGKIAWVGPESEIPKYLPAQEVHLKGRWVLPGLIDCHTHIVYAGNRAAEFEARLEGVSYTEISARGGGIFSTVKATRTAPLFGLISSAASRGRDFVFEGVTTLDVKSGYGLDLETELKMLRVGRELATELGIKTVCGFLGAHACPPGQTPDEYIRSVIQVMLPAVARAGLIDYVDAFLETVAFDSAQVDQLFTAARQAGIPVRLHADQLSDSGGAAVAARHKALSADHLEYTSEDSVRAMAESGTVAVLLPVAFLMLRESRRPPVPAFREHGVPMAVSTDCNPGTSPCTSLRLAMSMACAQFGLTPIEALRGVTVVAAQALGITETTGTLELGKDADLSIWNIDHPRELVAQIGGSMLQASYCRGQKVTGVL